MLPKKMAAPETGRPGKVWKNDHALCAFAAQAECFAAWRASVVPVGGLPAHFPLTRSPSSCSPTGFVCHAAARAIAENAGFPMEASHA